MQSVDGAVDSTQRYQRVLQPLTIGNCTIPNRIVRTAHQTGRTAGSVNDDLIAYHVARARGGVGLSFLETASVHSSSPVFLDMSTDHAVDGMARLVEAVKPYGMKLFHQLWHGGTLGTPLDGSPAWSASPYPFYMDHFFPPRVPIEMTRTMIDSLVEAFRNAAERVVNSGCDGLEVHGGHDYLLHQFLSPVTNQRSDEYGGTLENRMRFLVDILEAIRDAVPAGFPVGARFSSTDFYENGLGPEDIGFVISRLQDLRLINFVNLSVGATHDSNKLMGTAFESRGYQLKYHEPFNDKIEVPRIVTGRIMTLDEAESILAEGKAELVSMVRATIADPNLVRKSLEQKAPRPCISCNTCSASVATGLVCSVNATAGQEAALADDEVASSQDAKRVVIAGGGPAGLEAARIAAMRGHQVTLVESRDKLGGQINFAASVPGRRDMARIVDWLAEEVAGLNVDVRLSTIVNRKFFSDIGDIDVFINATGPRQRDQFLQSAVPMLDVPIDDPNIMKLPWHIFAGAEAGDGRQAIVVDDTGFFEGASVVLCLLDKGWDVALVARTPQLAPETYPTHHNRLLRERMYKTGRFSFYGYSYVSEVGTDFVKIGNLLESVPPVELNCDMLVPVLFMEPGTDISTLAAGHTHAVHTIGDALAPHRSLQAITWDANRIAREL